MKKKKKLQMLKKSRSKSCGSLYPVCFVFSRTSPSDKPAFLSVSLKPSYSYSFYSTLDKFIVNLSKV